MLFKSSEVYLYRTLHFFQSRFTCRISYMCFKFGQIVFVYNCESFELFSCSSKCKSRYNRQSMHQKVIEMEGQVMCVCTVCLLVKPHEALTHSPHVLSDNLTESPLQTPPRSSPSPYKPEKRKHDVSLKTLCLHNNKALLNFIKLLY